MHPAPDKTDGGTATLGRVMGKHREEDGRGWRMRLGDVLESERGGKVCSPWNIKRRRDKHTCSFCTFKRKCVGTSLVVQWVSLHAPNAAGLGSIPGRGTRSRIHAATKDPACRN